MNCRSYLLPCIVPRNLRLDECGNDESDWSTVAHNKAWSAVGLVNMYQVLRLYPRRLQSRQHYTRGRTIIQIENEVCIILVLPSMKCIRSLFSVWPGFFAKSQLQLQLVRVWRETSRHQHRRHPSRRGLAQTERLLFFLGKPRTKGTRFALARLIVKYDYSITGQSGMPAQQYDSTAGAGRPTPQQPSIGCGLPGPYGGDVYGKAHLSSADICISLNVSPRL